MKDRKLYDRLLEKIVIDESTGCWNWTGYAFDKRPYPGNRYGCIGIRDPETNKSRTIATHRAMWFAVHGKPAAGQCVCHSCDNPKCVNPNHLWLGSRRDNTMDMIKKNRHHLKKKTHCKRGHLLYGVNVMVTADGYRHCKICERGRLRMRWGWPEDLAFSVAPLPLGHVMNKKTGVVITESPKARMARKRSHSAGGEA